MASTFSNLLYHLVFTTKGRLPLIHDDLRDRLYEYMGAIIRGEGGILLEIGGMPDHLHLLVKLKTDIAVSMMVQKIKGNSSRWINGLPEHKARFEWQSGYGIFSVSQSATEKVRQYIRGQEENHRRVSFRDELVALLRRNGISYEEKHLLG